MLYEFVIIVTQPWGQKFHAIVIAESQSLAVDSARRDALDYHDKFYGGDVWQFQVIAQRKIRKAHQRPNNSQMEAS